MNPTPTPLSTAMEAAKRYDISDCDGESGRCRAKMEPCTMGDWVSFEDYEALQKHFQPLLAKVEAQRDEACERFREATSLNAWTLEEFGKVRADLAAKEAALGLVLPYAQMLFEGRKPYGAGADVLPCIIADARSALASRADKGGAT